MSANALSMSLAEWLMRMSIARVPAAARTLALYASVLDITGNDELASVTGISGRTFDKHKQDLVRGGWVLITRRTGGRGNGIEVSPAVNETPVRFTDVSKGNPRKICARLAQQTPASFAEDLKPETPAEFAPVLAETPAVVAEVSAPHAPARAYKELPSEVVIYQNVKPPLSPVPTFGYDERARFENGQITLDDSLRQYWLDRFDGDAGRLDLALIQAAGYIQPNSRRPIEAQVSAQLARAVSDKLDRDKRYAAAVKRNGADQPKEGSTNRTMRIGRMLREMDQSGRRA